MLLMACWADLQWFDVLSPNGTELMMIVLFGPQCHGLSVRFMQPMLREPLQGALSTLKGANSGVQQPEFNTHNANPSSVWPQGRYLSPSQHASCCSNTTRRNYWNPTEHVAVRAPVDIFLQP